jgi:dGTPase
LSRRRLKPRQLLLMEVMKKNIPTGLALDPKSAKQEVLQTYREAAEQKEEQLLFHKASLSKQHSRLKGAEEDHRLPYKRDVDRIIHSKAYARYVDKTQVVYLVENDHITHRGLHVQLVSSFARGIAEILRLNGDLVEAIALGHDVGHPPFGHEGEGYLSELSQEHGEGCFAHPWQSCRLLSELEPLNLGLAVYDGFLCHDGGMCGTKMQPTFGKNWEDHFKEKEQKIKNPEKNIWPATLEGCLVKLCDTMSYVGRDIEDAISIGILAREQLPETTLGKTNREILGALSADIIRNSYDRDYIAISDEAYEALRVLRNFNFKHIYTHPKLKVESKKIKRSYRILFETLLNDLKLHDKQSYVWKNFSHNKPESYLATTSQVRMIIDYIAGMTDNFFVRTLQKLIVPTQIELF